MAIIGKIRSYSWLILAFVGLALLAFILGDFFKKNPKENDTTLAIIAEKKINYHDFDQDYKIQQELIKGQYGIKSLDKNTSFQILQELWGEKVREIIYQKEAEELGLGLEYQESDGITICPEELTDLVIGKNPHQLALQFFTQGTGQPFNPSQVKQFLDNINQVDPMYRALWLQTEKRIKDEQLMSKYNTLVAKGLYVTKRDAQRDLDNRNQLATFRLVALNYNTINDKDVTVTAEEIQKYYEEHKYEYEQEKSRGIEYVLFNVEPSAEDLKFAKEDIESIKEEFIKDTDAEAFVNNKSDNRRPDLTYHKKGELDSDIDSVLFKAPVNTIVGPYQKDNFYKVAKLMERTMRPDSLKASHILFSFKGAKNADPKMSRTKAQAKAKADSVANEVRKDTARLAAIAGTISDDPSAKQNKGILGWFPDGQMVPSFNTACVNGKIGDVAVVETDFGYHVIRILDKTAPKEKIKVAIVEREIKPSEATFNAMDRTSNQFAADIASNPESWEKKITDIKQNKRVAEYVNEFDRQLPGMDEPTDLVRWVYNAETEIGSTSDVIRVGDKSFVVAKLTQIREKGFAPLEQIKVEMEAGAKVAKKGTMLSEKMAAQIKASSTIDQLANNLKVKVDTATGLGFSAFGIPTLGPEPAVIGTVFGLTKGKISNPIVGKAGVVAVVVDNIQKVPTPETVDQTKKQLMGYMYQRSAQEVFMALYKKANIEDNRGRFY